jgi:quinolinate synthase
MANSDAETIEKINRLRKSKNTIILAHNYQLGEVQDIADFIGDSLDLSQKAAKTEADVIIFCGVHFMAETAAIICPDKTVLLPEKHAGCPMANMITAPALQEKKREHPKAMVVCYINSSAAVKAESDVCCTSANAVKLVEKINAEEIIFVPDQYLGSYVASKTGKEMILWPGYCPTHVLILPQDITQRKAEYPQAKVIVHPECRTEVVALADAVLSTSQMVRFSHETEAKEIIVGTEIFLLHRLRKENPDKKFIPASEQAVCPNMKLTTLEGILWSLETMTNQIKVPERIRVRAKRAVDKMLEVT